MNNNLFTAAELRDKFNHVVGLIKKGEIPAKSYNSISFSSLEESQLLTNSKGDYTFKLRAPKTSSRPTEKLLDRNDLFYCLRLGVFLTREGIDFATKAAGKHATFVDRSIFPPILSDTAEAGFVREHLEQIYKGTLSVKSNDKEFVPALPLEVFRYVPNSQGGIVLSVNGGTVPAPGVPNGQNIIADSEIEFGAGTFPIEPNPLLEGAQNFEVKVSFPTFDGINIAATEAGFGHFLVVKAYGLLIRNANKA